ncbi:TPA: sugar transporter, partial [Escherichia coli]|nr:sugar transporter [Escherichia coli]
INQGQIILFVSRKDIPVLPVKDQSMKINGKNYIVDEVSDNVGVLEITLTVNTNRGMPI